MSGACEHTTCNPANSLWLPRLDPDDASGLIGPHDPIDYLGQLKAHRYCRKCGLVKVEGDGRGRKAGYYLSLVAKLRRHIERGRTGKKITTVDMRLICQEIRDRSIFTDPYGSRSAAQEKALIDIIMARRGDLDRKIVREFVREYDGIQRRKRPRST